MQKIDKSLMLATKYKKWLDTLNAKNEKHTIYNSSKGKYYYDIVANLIWVQAGLCAYSERLLQEPARFSPGNWANGVFPKFPFSGQLDHYDATLKEQYGWSWDNFFVIDSDINVKLKRTNIPTGLLKPDMPHYDPRVYLEYERTHHVFVPNRLLEFPVQEQVRKDISCLGINFQPIIDIRKYYLEPLFFDVEYQVQSRTQVQNRLYQFFTAFDLVADRL
ncbi:hypothetical protein HHL17_11140 [Chitinophaga sp. G-6-1-13]|uniref:Uncharacterized protein n=1 Tax=Chitinophaga fulva TaxID=2728842 RepID=A0A848GK21_9BACT|nr:hypothetical protein [Chitinophaga fulva]NML37749.1 hypothetical protein [Chitinophaga fulva]